ncbi:MAG: InlB B-repeat-containing protein, partial [Candidatus Scatosoma sp.]
MKKKAKFVSFLGALALALVCAAGAGCKSGDEKTPAEGTTYTVSFETYGGTVIKDKTYTVGKMFNMPQNPTRYGYDFKGWYLDEAFTQPFSSADVSGISSNITLYAKFEKGVYKVNFTTGTAQQIEAVSFSVGDTLTLPTPEARTVAGKEYPFSYWYNEQTGMPAEATTFTADFPGDMYFKAVYDTGLTGAFDLLDDGTYVSLNLKSATLLKDTEAAYGTYEVNVAYTDLTATGVGLIVKAQLDYSGAAYETANDSYVYIRSNPSVGAFQIATWNGTGYNALTSTVYANTTANFKAKYDALKNGTEGANNVFAYKVTFTPDKISLFVDGELQAEANTAGKEIPDGLGVGFRTANKGIRFASPVVTPSHYKVTYDADGGNTLKADYVEIGQKLSGLPVAEKTGYDFVKWQLNGADFTADEEINGNITLKAVYEQKPGGAVISFDSAGGSAHESVYVESNVPVGVLPVPVKIGYRFSGWTYGDNVTADENTIFNTGSGEPEQITLKANWEVAGNDDLTTVTSILGKPYTVTATENDYTKITSSANAIGSIGVLNEGKFSV